ncbi:MAG TPA: hypothetical protein VIX83_13820 [Candidatus Cybelea sp.]
MQRAWQDDPKYKDTEFAVYHFPRQYFDQINGGEKFVYYRPSRGAKAAEASVYFGCGELGDWWTDPGDPTHRFVDIRKPIPFANLVHYVDRNDRMYESTYTSRNAFQGRSVRYVADLDFFRILDAAGVTGAVWQDAPTVEAVLSGFVAPGAIMEPPRDAFRPLTIVPDGTGYRPTGKTINAFEAAALQERARGDHQDTLKLVKSMAEARGGRCLFNNNVDLLASFADQKLLVEAKSLNIPSAAVDRMRYGMGQLFDYAVRYRAEIGEAKPVLAFGSMPSQEVGWITTILQETGVAFIARQRNALLPMNDAARVLPLFS